MFKNLSNKLGNLGCHTEPAVPAVPASSSQTPNVEAPARPPGCAAAARFRKMGQSMRAALQGMCLRPRGSNQDATGPSQDIELAERAEGAQTVPPHPPADMTNKSLLSERSNRPGLDLRSFKPRAPGRVNSNSSNVTEAGSGGAANSSTRSSPTIQPTSGHSHGVPSFTLSGSPNTPEGISPVATVRQSSPGLNRSPTTSGSQSAPPSPETVTTRPLTEVPDSAPPAVQRPPLPRLLTVRALDPVEGSVRSFVTDSASQRPPHAPVVENAPVRHFLWAFHDARGLSSGPQPTSSGSGSDLLKAGAASANLVTDHPVQGSSFAGRQSVASVPYGDDVHPWLARVSADPSLVHPSRSSLVPRRTPSMQLIPGTDDALLASSSSSMSKGTSADIASLQAQQPRAGLPARLQLDIPGPARSLVSGSSQYDGSRQVPGPEYSAVPRSPFYGSRTENPNAWQHGPKILISPVKDQGKGKARADYSAIASSDDAPHFSWPPPGSALQKTQRFTDSLPDIELPNVNLGPVVGHGAFSVVHKTQLLIDGTLTTCALKTFRRDSQDVGRAEVAAHLLILDKLGSYSPHLVRYYGQITTVTDENGIRVVPPGTEGGILSIAMSWVEGKTLKELRPGFRHLEVEEQLLLLKNILENSLRGTVALEQLGMCQNDLKPDNFMVSGASGVMIDMSNTGTFMDDEKPMGHPFYTGPERIGKMPAEGLRNTGAPVSQIGLTGEERNYVDEIAQKGLDDFAPHLKPLHDTVDSWPHGQMAHEIMEGHVFLPVRPEVMQRFVDTNFRDAMGVQLATIMGWTNPKVPAPTTIFSDERIASDPHAELKQKYHYYDFVNQAMNPDYTRRLKPSQLLNHPFITEHRPDEAQVQALYARAVEGAMSERAREEAEPLPATISQQGSSEPRGRVNYPASRSDFGTEESGDTGDLWQ